jgi:cobalt/nickel transport system permease protein
MFFNYSVIQLLKKVLLSGGTMHIPDAFMPLWQGAIYWIIALAFVALAIRWAKNQLTEEKVPLVAVLAAAVFALMSFNLPVSMGTSGHLVGGALVAIVLGSPFAAVFVLTLVLIVQGVLFGDGGITTMGANIINMGVIGGFVGFYSFHGLLRLTKNLSLSAIPAAWLACFIPAEAAAVEMFFAGTFPIREGLIAMGVYHALIGIIEGMITILVLQLIIRVRPDLVDAKVTNNGRSKPKGVVA